MELIEKLSFLATFYLDDETIGLFRIIEKLSFLGTFYSDNETIGPFRIFENKICIDREKIDGMSVDEFLKELQSSSENMYNVGFQIIGTLVVHNLDLDYCCIVRINDCDFKVKGWSKDEELDKDVVFGY